jgi:hypothetical protein
LEVVVEIYEVPSFVIVHYLRCNDVSAVVCFVACPHPMKLDPTSPISSETNVVNYILFPWWVVVTTQKWVPIQPCNLIGPFGLYLFLYV